MEAHPRDVEAPPGDTGALLEVFKGHSRGVSEAYCGSMGAHNRVIKAHRRVVDALPGDEEAYP